VRPRVAYSGQRQRRINPLRQALWWIDPPTLPVTGGQALVDELTSSLAKEGISVAPARATPIAYLQELFE
jgi:hypothetical protein